MLLKLFCVQYFHKLLPNIKRNCAMGDFRASHPEKYFWKKNL